MTGAGSRFRDLGPRLASGLVLGAVALAAVLAGSLWTALLFAVAAGIMAWEFRRIVGGAPGAGEVVMVLAAATSVLATEASLLRWGLVVLAAGAAALLALDGAARVRTVAGLGWIGVAMCAATGLGADPQYGSEAVLWLFVVVIASDIGGYFGGRLIGGRKLWPRFSPKKTWAGALSGMALAALAGALFSRWTTGTVVAEVAPVSALAALIAQGGDLAESALKRRFGVKDASRLIPGHGGLLDRLDGFMAAALVGGAITFARGRSVFAW